MYEVTISTPMNDTTSTLPTDNKELWNTLQHCTELDFDGSTGRVQSREVEGNTIRIQCLVNMPPFETKNARAAKMLEGLNQNVPFTVTVTLN